MSEPSGFYAYTLSGLIRPLTAYAQFNPLVVAQATGAAVVSGPEPAPITAGASGYVPALMHATDPISKPQPSTQPGYYPYSEIAWMYSDRDAVGNPQIVGKCSRTSEGTPTLREASS